MLNDLTIGPSALLAIAAMGVCTYATRAFGAMVLRRHQPGPMLKAGLDALPVAVLTAVIAPSVAAGGPADWAAAAVTAVAAFRLPLLATFAVGVASVVAFRALL